MSKETRIFELHSGTPQDCRMLATLKKLVDTNSGSANLPGIRLVVAQCRHFLQSLGFLTETFGSPKYGDCLVARYGDGSGLRVLAVGHADTVFSDPATQVPFSSDATHCYGGGVGDMKGGLVVMLEGVAKAIGSGLSNLDLTIIINGDEEISSPLSRSIIQRESRRSSLALVFEPAPDRQAIITKRAGRVGLSLSVVGRTAHAGKCPESGASAISEIIEKVARIELVGRNSNTCSVVCTLIRGGEVDNVVPGKASAEFDIRFQSTRDLDSLRGEIDRIVATPTSSPTAIKTTEGVIHPPLVYSEETEPYVRLLQECAQSRGLDIRSSAPIGGVGDANWISQQGIPVIDGMGPAAQHTHSERECIVTESLVERKELFAEYLLVLAR